MFRFFLISICLTATTVYSQWQWVHPQPQGNNLNDIKSISKNEVIVVGDYGTILKSINSGKDWQLIESRLNSNLNSISVVGNNIWICGDGGIIINSSDYGTSWNYQTSNTSSNLNSIFFLDSLNGFSGGGYWNSYSFGSTFLRTTNGGKNWEKIEVATKSTINKISFINKEVGFMCGGIPYMISADTNAVFLKTTDGGLTWNGKSFNRSDFTSLYFVNENVGYLTSEGSYYFKTSDGGDTWTLNLLPGPGNCVFF